MKKSVLALACAMGGLLAFGAAEKPEIEFVKAIREGKPLTAEAAYRRAVEAKKDLPAKFHFEGAHVAEMCGKDLLARDRYARYVREEKGNTPELKYALWRLIRTSQDLDLLERLCQVSPKDESVYGAAMSIMSRQREAERYNEILATAGILLKHYDADRVFGAVWDRLRHINTGSWSQAKLGELMTKYACPGSRNYDRCVEQWPHALGAVGILSVSAHAGKFVGNWWMSWAFDNADRDKDRVADALKAAKKLEPLVFADGVRSDVLLTWYRFTANHRREYYADANKENGQSGECAERLLKILAKKDIWRKANRGWDLMRLVQDGLDQNWWTRAGAAKVAAATAEGQLPARYMWRYLSSKADIANLCEEAKSGEPIEKVLKRYPSRAEDFLGEHDHFGPVCKWGTAANVKVAVRALTTNGIDFDFNALRNALSCEKLSADELADLLQSCYIATGYSKGWDDFAQHVKKNEKDKVCSNAKMKNLAATVKKDVQAGDPLIRAARAAADKDPEKSLAGLEAAFKAFPGTYPDWSKRRETALVGAAIGSCAGRVWDNRDKKRDCCGRFADLVLSKANGDLAAVSLYNHVRDRANESRNADVVNRLYAWRAKNLGEPETDGEAGRVVRDYALNGLKANDPAYAERLVTLFKNYDFTKFDEWWWHVSNLWNAILENPEVGKSVPFEKIDAVTADGRCAYEVFKTRCMCGQCDAGLPTYMKAVSLQKTPEARINMIASVFDIGYHVKGQYQRPCHQAVLAKVLPTLVKELESVSEQDAPKVRLSLRLLMDAASWAEDNWLSKDEKVRNEEGHKLLMKLYAQEVRLQKAGVEIDERAYYARPWRREMFEAFVASNAVRNASIAALATRSMPGTCPWPWVTELLNKAKGNFGDEPLYIFANHQAGVDQNEISSLASRMAGELASKLPGIYPVSEKDPSYPLYVAADELAHQNAERAWELLKAPNNLATFERVAAKLPPEFVIWGVEHIRLARGAKDELLLKARAVATAVLQQESKITKELAAAMVLSRAETYRDQQNFEAARLEYQSVRDNPNYRGTKAARQAMFRAVDLMIATGNAQGAEPVLEYWLSQPDPEIQAEAHYFLALIAFDRKDYDETIKQLRQVFALDFTHTEARLLQGKWKLATNSEVDETEVMIGSIGDRTVVRPGQQLTINVQDANLSVAGGGASIPVIVTTQPGGDRERIELYPSPRDPALFKGVASVELGKAAPGNLTLEVRGDDTVSYVIDPAFLKERGLPLNAPKNLSVVDDARLAVGSGAPKSEDEKGDKDALDALMEETSLNASARRLRPGNPLYVVIRDRDAAIDPNGSSVKVNVSTTSGDRLDDFVLREEKPFTGVFRAKIPTSLPPPRALASDTAAGYNPGDAINSEKTTEWRSLADSQPGKWFAVDTMSSHMVAKTRLETPSMADIKAVRLVGSLGGRDIILGSLPVVPVAQKVGLRRQQQNNVSFQSLDAARAFFATGRGGGKDNMKDLSHVVRWGGHRHHETSFIAGPFQMPEGYDTLRFKIVAKNTKCAAPLQGLRLRIAVDGTQIFDGGGRSAPGRNVVCDITPGCHYLEVAATSTFPDDGFELWWEPFGQDAKPLPVEWFDVTKHEALLDFMRDQATIARTNDAFVAELKKPMRLRSVRWEFTDVKSPDVRVKKLYVTDAAGQDVIPVKNDFSTASQNGTLEVAPGDKITVTYADQRNSAGEKKVIQSQIESSFSDAHVRFIYEKTNKRGELQDYDAYRFRPGDTLVVCVQDSDLDETDEPDKVKVAITCQSTGKSYGKTLLEAEPKWLYNIDRSAYGMHTGCFLGLVKTVSENAAEKPKNAIPVSDNDVLKVTYEDRENTDPGVPTVRTATIQSISATKPEITFFTVSKKRVPDHSLEARAALDRIRRRPGNENVTEVYKDELTAVPMEKEVCASTNPIPVNVAAPIPVRVNDPSSARFAESTVTIALLAESERAAAEAAGREPVQVKVPLLLNGKFGKVLRLVRGDQSPRDALRAGSFNGLVNLSIGPIDPNIEVPEDAPPLLSVTGSDKIHLSLLDEKGEVTLERTLELVSNGTLELMDSSFSAPRTSVHVGENFFIRLDDADQDTTDEPDKIEIEAVSEQTGKKRPVILTETMPHSGVFTGRLRPVMFAPGEVVPAVADGKKASDYETQTEERFAVGYGDTVIFRYNEKKTLPGTPARTLEAKGSVFRGSNGDVRLFSKRFADRDTAVLVQFRLAECLFEQAKEFRKLKQTEKSSEAIAEGKFILEEALKNFPDSTHVVQGEFLLANLYQELGSEKKDAKDDEGARPLFQEALARFSAILATWPDGDFAAKSQFHKAFCLEQLGDYARAGEEYVKMTYLYPESDLVGDATIRLATYYYSKEKRYDISGHIYRNFQRRFPQHEKAARALFMAGSCYIKQAETLQAEDDRRVEAKEKRDVTVPGRISDLYGETVKTFQSLLETYDGPNYIKLRAQAMYWIGDVSVRRRDYKTSYKSLKRCILEYPETEWARRARGLLLQEESEFSRANEE